MWKLLTVTIWLTTLIMLPTYANGILYPKAICWFMGSFALASSCWWNHPRQQTVSNPAIGIFLCYALAWFSWQAFRSNLTTSQTLNSSIIGLGIPASFWPVFTIIGSILAMDALVRHTDYLQRWEVVAETLCYVAGVIALYGFLQLLNFDQLFHTTTRSPGMTRLNAPITFFGNPLLTANFLAICAPLCLMFRQARFKALYALSLIVILGSETLSSIVGCLGGTILFYTLRRDWRVVFAWAAFCLAGILFTFLAMDVTRFWTSPERIGVWNHAITVLHEERHWWTGFGPGSVAAATANGFWSYGRLHSEPIQWLFEWGFIGIAIIFSGLGLMLNRLRYCTLTTLLTGYIGSFASLAVIACVSFPLDIAPMVMVAVLIWAALTAHISGGRSYVPA